MASTFSESFGQNDVGVADFNFSFNSAGASDPDEDVTYGRKVASIVHSATGKYTVTLDGAYYRVLAKHASLDDISTGDGAYASIYCADATANPLVFVVWTFAADGTKTDYTDRRVSVSLKLKVSAGN